MRTLSGLASFSHAYSREIERRQAQALAGWRRYQADRRPCASPPVCMVQSPYLARVFPKSQKAKKAVLLLSSPLNTPRIFALHGGHNHALWWKSWGYDVYVVSWSGAPFWRSGQVACLSLREALDHIVDPALSWMCDHYQDTVVMGYCLGGVMALLGAAGAKTQHVRCIGMATPWSGLGHASHMFLRPWMRGQAWITPEAWGSLFFMMNPFSAMNKYRSWHHAHMRQSGDHRFYAEDWIQDFHHLKGAFMGDMLDFLSMDLEEKKVFLKDRSFESLEKRTCFFVASKDHLVPEYSSYGVVRDGLAGDVQKVDTGHLGLMLSQKKIKGISNHLACWLKSR